MADIVRRSEGDEGAANSSQIDRRNEREREGEGEESTQHPAHRRRQRAKSERERERERERDSARTDTLHTKKLEIREERERAPFFWTLGYGARGGGRLHIDFISVKIELN